MTMDSHSEVYVGIDPGKSGAICVIEDDFIKAIPCPDNIQDMAPQKWIKYFETPKLEKSRRKRYLRDKARSMYPDLKKVTLKTADAILIASYAKETHNNS